MTSSGTFNFNPSVTDVSVQALLRCGVKRTAIEPEHMADARFCANMVLKEWANDQPRLWTVDLYSQVLSSTVASYTLPAETILTLDVYLSTTVSGVTTDKLLYPISRTDYASYPNKANLAPPSVYWFNRQIIPTITFYQTPDANGPYTAKIYRVRHIQDANPTMGQTPDLPQRFLPAFTAGLAARLSEIYAPDRYDALETRHKERLGKATNQDQENAPITIQLDLSSYFR